MREVLWFTHILLHHTKRYHVNFYDSSVFISLYYLYFLEIYVFIYVWEREKEKAGKGQRGRERESREGQREREAKDLKWVPYWDAWVTQ